MKLSDYLLAGVVAFAAYEVYVWFIKQGIAPGLPAGYQPPPGGDGNAVGQYFDAYVADPVGNAVVNFSNDAGNSVKNFGGLSYTAPATGPNNPNTQQQNDPPADSLLGQFQFSY